ncbi:uncharacterized protein LOC125667021 [Ostrea edulis]|uniref:uncharacterized protein LOC125667021 n=1 Tax=Ostrea edulis TaxID=37623 RepID=UPI0024AF32EB|nr:uncharacterized protein LOC125667021 [Ostrea edulis]
MMRNEEDKTQNNKSMKYTNAQIERLSKIYNPDKKTVLQELRRLREDPVELDPIEENDAETDNIEEKLETTELESEFRDGTEYLQWLDCQLPYLQPFESQYAVHHYFFRYWSRNEQYQFIPEMEPLIEMDEDIDGHSEYVNDAADKENIWEEGLKPEFESGRQLVKWLERKLPFLESFAPDDAIHYCFNREWSRMKFEATFDALVEEHIETASREDAAPHSHVDEDNIKEEIEDINPYINMMASPRILDGFLLQKMVLQKDEVETKSNEERETPTKEIEPLDNAALGDTPKTKMGKNKIKKGKRSKMSVLFRLFGH